MRLQDPAVPNGAGVSEYEWSVEETAQAAPHALRRERNLIEAHARGVAHGVGHRRRDAIHGDLRRGLGPVWAGWLVGLDEDSL